VSFKNKNLSLPWCKVTAATSIWILLSWRLPRFARNDKNCPVIAMEQSDCGNLMMNRTFLEIATLSLDALTCATR